MSRLRQPLQIEMPLGALFEAPTVAALAMYVETARQAGRLAYTDVQYTDGGRIQAPASTPPVTEGGDEVEGIDRPSDGDVGNGPDEN